LRDVRMLLETDQFPFAKSEGTPMPVEPFHLGRLLRYQLNPGARELVPSIVLWLRKSSKKSSLVIPASIANCGIGILMLDLALSISFDTYELLNHELLSAAIIPPVMVDPLTDVA